MNSHYSQIWQEKTMFSETVREFLQKPLLARMSTLGADGYPHTVPVWFMLDGEEIVVISVRKTRKVGHIKADPRGAIMIGGDVQDGTGYLIKGDFQIEEDPGLKWMKTVTLHYESGAQAEKDIADWSKLDMIVIRLKPKSVTKV
jgi:PPOX class probable F420-dependent enzyme